MAKRSVKKIKKAEVSQAARTRNILKWKFRMIGDKVKINYGV